MVCKEELCCWFKNLNPRKRIDYMCALLHMCLPLELRFVGTVLEDYGKKDYHYLRIAEGTANKQTEIAKYKNITSPKILRAKVFVTLSLMRSSSTTCAQIIYDIIESNLDTVFSFHPGDDSNVADEVLTVLTLATNHPAFMFEQRRRFHEHLCSLDNQRRDTFREKVDEDEVPLNLYSENHIPHYRNEEPPIPIHPPLCNRHSPITQPRKVFVQNIEVLPPKKAAEYRILATWSNGEITEVGKRFRDIQEFHRQMMDSYPDEKPPSGRIPSLPDRSPHPHSREEHIQEQIRALNTYFRSLTCVPSHILESDLVCQFFKGLVICQAQPQLPLIPHSMPYHQSMGSVPDDASRIPRFMPPPLVFSVPQRFQTSHTCQPLLMQALPLQQQAMQQHQQQQQQQQQPSPVSPPRSELSSTTTSPAGSRSASPDLATSSVVQLLKLLGLDKYAGALGRLSFEELSRLSGEELSKLGLPQDAQHALRHKLDHINSEKQAPINGVMDSLAYPALSVTSPPSPSWIPMSSYYRPNLQPSPRSVHSMADTLPGGMSDLVSRGSPPVSPGPPHKMQPGLLGKAPAGDSSEGSEDLDRDKGDSLSEAGKVISHQQGKSAQVKVSPGSSGGGGGGSNSPCPPSVNPRMTPPDDGAAKATILPTMQPGMPQMMPYYQYHPTPLPAPGHAPPGLLGQYMDPKADMGLMGAVHNPAGNSNNSNFTTEAMPIVSTGMALRPVLLAQTGVGVGAGTVRAPFKAGQPQPAHTNMGVLQGKSLMPEPKPGSPGIPMPYVGLRPSEIQTPMGQGIVTSTAGPLYHMPYGRGQGGPIVASHLPPVHQTQPGVIPFPLVTRSVQTSLPGSGSVMTVSASHPVTMVTASHQTAATAPSIHRSPSHGSNGNGQRDSGNESISGNSSVMTDSSLRASPLQVGGVAVTVTQVAAAPSPPVSHHSGCQQCAQGAQYSPGQYQVMYPFPYIQGPNGLIQHPAMPGYYQPNQQLVSGMMTNGYTPEMYSYNHPAYPTMNPASHMYHMMQGNTQYHSQSQPTLHTAQGGNGGPTVPPQAPAAAGGGLIASGQQQASNMAVKQRNTGCYNCGSLAHKAADCQESSMENMSGKSVYQLDYKPHDESD
ncbi:zinc finger CCHC domain-containing protein 2-like isoform X2 [Littorina saxatilis]|uniref:CCHC-type domain-containing protein n=1 Tax=Littorina saxatilis TaxID=31220 RepID=A0AAN9GME6_9CAEN